MYFILISLPLFFTSISPLSLPPPPSLSLFLADESVEGKVNTELCLPLARCSRQGHIPPVLLSFYSVLFCFVSSRSLSLSLDHKLVCGRKQLLFPDDLGSSPKKTSSKPKLSTACMSVSSSWGSSICVAMASSARLFLQELMRSLQLLWEKSRNPFFISFFCLFIVRCRTW